MSFERRTCQCRSKKIIRKEDESPQLQTVEVYLSQNANKALFTILKLSSAVIDFKCVNILLENMIESNSNLMLPEPNFLSHGLAYCEGFLRLHPPCIHTGESYLLLLKDKFLPAVKMMRNELNLAVLGVLPGSYTRHKVRRNYNQEYSKDIVFCVEKLISLEKKVSDLSPQERLSRLFTPFSFMVNVLRQDMLTRNASSPSKSDGNPLILDLLWEGVNTSDVDKITNNTTGSIFDFYVNCWHNDIKPVHLKTLARLIGTMGEAVHYSEKLLNCDSFVSPKKHASTEKRGSPQKAFSGLSVRALNEIENVTRRVWPRVPLYTCNVGHLRSQFAKGLASSLRNRCTCKKECQFAANAILFFQPVWLRLYVTSHFLKQEPTISVMKECLEQDVAGFNAERNSKSNLTSNLKRILYSAAEGTIVETWRRINNFRKGATSPKRMKIEPMNLSVEERKIVDFMNLLRNQRRMTNYKRP